MNSDLEKLLELRARMSYLFALREKRKRDLVDIAKHIEKQQEYIREENRKYNNSLKFKPELIKYKQRYDELKCKRYGFINPIDYLSSLDILIYIVTAIVGVVAGGTVFFIFKEEWLHISTWAYSVFFQVIFHLFALIVFALVFAVGALLIVGFGLMVSWLICLPIWRKRENEIYALNGYLFGRFGQKKDPYLPHEKAKQACDNEVARYKRIIDDDNKLAKKYVDELRYTENQFNNTTFIIKKEDYKYLDYLIYLMSSNRAANIYQALQLLDAQLRHNELMEKIDSLENSINSSLKSLEKTIQENTFAIRSLEQSFMTESAEIKSLIREGNEISSMQLSKLKDIDNEVASIRRRYPVLRFD